MESELLKLKPKSFLCPYCGEWHECNTQKTLDDYDCEDDRAIFRCKNYLKRREIGFYEFYFSDGYFFYNVDSICSASHSSRGAVEISSIQESSEHPRVTFEENFTLRYKAGIERCYECSFLGECNFRKLSEQTDGRDIKITFGFEFEQSDYDKFSKLGKITQKESELKAIETTLAEKEQSLQERESQLKSLEQELEQQRAEENARQEKIKEEAIMAETTTKKTSIKAQLYEKSPKENLEILKAWAEKYKPTLRWAIPVASVYGAYRILNSNEFDLSVNNIAETCEKQLGFKVEFLENKKALKELMVIGGLSAGAYGAVKAVSCILGTNEEKDISVEEVETGMNQLESISKKFAWIQPKTEDMLPIAISVILVYVTLHKPKFTGKFANKVRDLTEDIRVKADTYIDLAKLFIQDKFNIDLSNEEEQKKMKICAFLVAMIGIFAFLYGKKVLGDKSKSKETGVVQEEKASKSVETFVEQAKVIIEKIAPTVYTTLITFLVSKKILMLEEPLELTDGNVEVVAEQEIPAEELHE